MPLSSDAPSAGPAPAPTTAADTRAMPHAGIRVHTQARRNHLLRRLWGRARALLGGVLLTVAAVLGWLAVLLPVHWLVDANGGDDDLTDDERAVFVAAGRLLLLVAMGSIGAWLAGRQLMRTRRGTVLWLRRFQYRDAIRVVEAALDHIGRTWRVVTLDDLSAPAVGLAPGLRLPNLVLTVVRREGPAVVGFLSTVGKIVAKAAAAGIVGLAVWSASRGEFLLLLASLPGGSGPAPDRVEGELLRLLVTVLAGELALLVVYLVLLLARLPLLGAFVLFDSVQDQMTAAESSKLRTVQVRDDVQRVVSSVVATSARALAPRLTVLRVHGDLWQDTVTALAGSCCAVVLDVSQLTDNVLWEVEEVAVRLRTRVVLVGHADRVAVLCGATADGGDPSGSGGAARLRTLLDGQEVLAYTTDLRGRLRFQRALFAELEATRGHARLDRHDVLRTVTVLLGTTLVVITAQRAAEVVSPWL